MYNGTFPRQEIVWKTGQGVPGLRSVRRRFQARPPGDRAWSANESSSVYGQTILSPNGKTWHLAAHDFAPIARLGEALGIPPIVAQLLLNRGLTDPESAHRFLKTPFGDLHE